MPIGTVDRITLESAGPIQARIAITDDYGADRSIVVGATEIGAALVAYCIGRKVPMPRHSERSLDVIDGAMTLVMEVGSKPPPRGRAPARPAS